MQDKAIISHLSPFFLTDDDLAARQSILDRLNMAVKQAFEEDAAVLLFGSSVTGLGFRESDVDATVNFSFNFGRNAMKSVLKDLKFYVIRQGFAVSQVLLRPKVPLLKLLDRTTGLKVDLTTQNRWGVRNSQMIKLYADLDERCFLMVHAVKCWAKSKGINDASTGTLSSYAYSILVISFLQGRNPHVLPRLQLLKYRHQRRTPTNIVDGFDTYFFDDIEAIRDSDNAEPLTSLLADFFAYYSSFDYKRDAVSIHSDGHAAWDGQMWTIEDPFETNHNLARTLSVKGFARIRAEFDDANTVFRHQGWNGLIGLPSSRRKGGRRCYNCGGKGHLMRDCPH